MEEETEQGVVLAANRNDVQEPAANGAGPAGLTWVEELAGPQDYWLTLTDAARVTRRQEVTIRRWVAAGALPVRNRPLGLNKRTRHVRASDLAKLSPIVDASATISGAAAQIDLLSIPAKQAEILGQYQQVQQQMQMLSTQVETAGREQHQIKETIQRIQTEVGTRFQQAEKRQEALGREVASLKQSAQRLSGNLKELQEEQKAIHDLRQHEVEQLRAFDEIQSQHLSRIERLEKHAERIDPLEKRLGEEAREGAKQRRRIDELQVKMNSVLSTIGKLEKALEGAVSARRRAEEAALGQMNRLERSVSQLAQELNQQKDAAGRQLAALQIESKHANEHSRQITELVNRQGRQLEQIAQQVLALAAATPDQSDEKKTKRTRRVRLST